MVWLPSPTGVYDARSAWEAVRTKFPVQPWAKVVWFKKNAPRWAFILWLAAQGKLNTKDRLHKWGMTADEICPLRSREQETHKHLFFGCGLQYGASLPLFVGLTLWMSCWIGLRKLSKGIALGAE